MSRRGWARQRAELFGIGASERARPAAAGERRDLVGRDLADRPRRARRRSGLRLPLALGAIAAALLLVTLRVEILRMRYALAEVASQEEELRESARRATVEVMQLRDPARLRRLAEERGFKRPERMRTVEVPAAAAPHVAAAPAGAVAEEERP
jgi:cell division protein FtsL